jgi:hypothetical protein
MQVICYVTHEDKKRVDIIQGIPEHVNENETLL